MFQKTKEGAASLIIWPWKSKGITSATFYLPENLLGLAQFKRRGLLSISELKGQQNCAVVSNLVPMFTSVVLGGIHICGWHQERGNFFFFGSLLAILAQCLSCFVLLLTPHPVSPCPEPLPTSLAAKLESHPVKELAVALLGMTPPRSALQTQRNESLMLEFYVLFDKIFQGRKVLRVLLKLQWAGGLLLSCLYYGVFHRREVDRKGLASTCMSVYL